MEGNFWNGLRIGMLISAGIWFAIGMAYLALAA